MICKCRLLSAVFLLSIILQVSIFAGGKKETSLIVNEIEPVRDIITVQDSADRIVRLPHPVKRVAVLWSNPAEEIRALGAADRIVGIDQSTKVKADEGFYPELVNIPVIGTWDEPNYEAIAALNPDVLIMLSSYPPLPDEVQKNLDLFGIPVVALDFYRLEVYFREVTTLGFILGLEDRAEEYIAFFNDILGDIGDKISKIPQAERKRVYFEGVKEYQTYGGAGYGSGVPQIIRMAGGIDLYPEFLQTAFEVDPEDVAVRNPDVIFKGTPEGYYLNDPLSLELLRNEITSRRELRVTEAVQNEEVYTISWDIAGGARKKFGPIFLAKVLYPESVTILRGV